MAQTAENNNKLLHRQGRWYIIGLSTSYYFEQGIIGMRKASRLLAVAVALVMAIALGACTGPEPIQTGIGSFTYEQKFMPEIEDLKAGEGNTLLVIYLTPAAGTPVDLDAAREYFYSGTRVELAGETYDFKALAYEKVDGSYIRYGLIFEVKDNGYSEKAEQPQVKLILPQAAGNTAS